MNKEYHETSKKHKKWKIHLSLLPSMFQFRSIDDDKIAQINKEVKEGQKISRK